MSFKFNINETIEKEIFYGSYAIYILGGHHINVNPNFYVQIVNIETNEDVELTEKTLKPKDYKSGKKAVKYYTFEIMNYGKFKISVHNFEDIVIKDSILEAFPFPFLLPNMVKSFITGSSKKDKPLNEIEILIE